MLTFFPIQAQKNEQKTIDSLELRVKNSYGVSKIDASMQLIIEYASIENYDKSLVWAYKTNRSAYELGDSIKIVKSSRLIGQLLNQLTRAKEAEEILLKALTIAIRNNLRSERKLILNNLAMAYTTQAKFDRALYMNFQALILREEDNDKTDVNVSLNNIGVVYFKLHNFDKAVEYYKRSLFLKREINDNYHLDKLLINIGLCYNQLNDFSNAHKYFEKAFEVCKDKCSEQIIIEGENGLGVSYFERGDFNNAQVHFNKSYLISKKIGSKIFQAENLLFLSRIYIHRNEISIAIDALEKCELIASELNFNETLIEIYKEFSFLYDDLKNYEKASYYQKKYIALKDSIYSEQLIDNLAKIQTDYAQRENTATIATKEEVIQRQRSLNIAIIIIAALAVLLILVLYQNIKVKRKVNQALSEAKGIIELKNKELDKKVADKTADLEVANQSLVKVNSELDNFIYKTSHDIRGPLASLKGICNVALMDVKDPLAFDYLRKLDVTAEHLNTILTRLLIINQINNSAMKAEVINFDTIIDEVLLLEKKKGMPDRIKVIRNIQSDMVFYSDREFMRIILENLIDNAIKFHNDSSRIDPFVEVHVEQRDEHVIISVIDNGIGFMDIKPDKIFQMFSRASERSTTGGIGLYITKTATEKLGGIVGLRNTHESYTEFYVKFPIKAQWFETPDA